MKYFHIHVIIIVHCEVDRCRQQLTEEEDGQSTWAFSTVTLLVEVRSRTGCPGTHSWRNKPLPFHSTHGRACWWSMDIKHYNIIQFLNPWIGEVTHNLAVNTFHFTVKDCHHHLSLKAVIWFYFPTPGTMVTLHRGLMKLEDKIILWIWVLKFREGKQVVKNHPVNRVRTKFISIYL